MRAKDQHTILYWNMRKPKLAKTKSFVDNCNYKNYYQENDQLELNWENKLFILNGKKFNQFFCYDFDRNEMMHLAETKYSHFYGNLIYVPLNNCIYCLGGINTKKCEIYRNDEIVYSNYAQDIKINRNSWENIPDMHFYRQEFSSLLFNTYLYVFFGFNNSTNSNNNTIERLNVLKNDRWESVTYSNCHLLNLSLSSHASLVLNDTDILILGGFDGKSYLDTGVIYTVNTNIVKPVQMKIPDIKKNCFYHFFKESRFIKVVDYEYISDAQNFNFALVDSKDRIHVVNTRKMNYEIYDGSAKY